MGRVDFSSFTYVYSSLLASFTKEVRWSDINSISNCFTISSTSQNQTLLKMAWFAKTNAVKMVNHTTGVGHIVAGHIIGNIANPEV
jgi:uncharacterized protein involved in propanediol utilization